MMVLKETEKCVFEKKEASQGTVNPNLLKKIHF